MILVLPDGSTTAHLVKALELYRRRLRGDGMQLPEDLQTLLDAASRDRRGQAGTATAGSSSVADDGDMAPQLLTYDEAADRCRISERQIKRYVADGSLPTVKLGAARRVHVQDLADFIDSLRDSRRKAS